MTRAGSESRDAGSVGRGNRMSVVERLWLAADVQVRAHEARLNGLAPAEASTEAQAKALATLARTIRELIELDAAAGRAEQEPSAHDAIPDAALADLGSLRAELARRLEGLAAGGEGTAAG